MTKAALADGLVTPSESCQMSLWVNHTPFPILFSSLNHMLKIVLIAENQWVAA